MKIAVLVLFLMALRGQDGTTICGWDNTGYSPNVSLVQVSCVDYDELKKHVPIITASGKETQVIVHARAGDTVAVTLGGLTKLAPLTRDSYGRLTAMVQFPGADYTTIGVRVFHEVK